MATKVDLSEIGRQLPASIDIFICTASFEERCTTVAGALSARVGQAIVIKNIESFTSASRHVERLRAIFPNNCAEVELSLSSPTQTADALKDLVCEKIGRLERGTVVIDITTFTHEQLLILLALVQNAPRKAEIILAYNGAAEYSTNTDEDHVWLSRGVRRVRSVLGYPGRLIPTKPLHLVVLVGFESERAQSLIEMMEPAMLSLGVGDPKHSVSSKHYARNQKFFDKLQQFLKRQSNQQPRTYQFQFSCVDPVMAQQSVLNHVRKFAAFNTVICPMNTKLSTVGVGMAAMQDDALQVVYAEADEYNEAGYSTPGDKITISRLASQG